MVVTAITPNDCEFYTPQYILEKVYRCFRVDCDPCSPVGYPNVDSAVHYTIEDNGLSKDWCGNIFLNPPYGRFIIDWVNKFIAELNKNVLNAILLVPMKSDTKWFNLLADKCTMMVTISGRVKFDNATSTGTFGSCMMLFSHDAGVISSFVQQFSDMGVVWTKLRT